jgi:hypothetical protein
VVSYKCSVEITYSICISKYVVYYKVWFIFKLIDL